MSIIYQLMWSMDGNGVELDSSLDAEQFSNYCMRSHTSILRRDLKAKSKRVQFLNSFIMGRSKAHLQQQKKDLRTKLVFQEK